MIDKKIIKLILKLRKIKYQNSLIKKNDLQSLIRIKNQIASLKHKKSNSLKFIIKDKSDKVYSDLVRIYKKKNLSSYEKKYIFALYKKYNVNLKLKKRYNKNLIKKSNSQTIFASYIYLALIVKKNNDINTLQLLNFILKINDHLLVSYQKIKNNDLFFLFLKSLKKEKSLIGML